MHKAEADHRPIYNCHCHEAIPFLDDLTTPSNNRHALSGNFIDRIGKVLHHLAVYG
jgi:hypothetical protein